MITIIEKTIEKVHFKLTVEETLPNDVLVGAPTLYINEEPHLVYPVDTLRIIKAIANSNNLIHVKKGIKETWNEKPIKENITQLEKEHGYV